MDVFGAQHRGYCETGPSSEVEGNVADEHRGRNSELDECNWLTVNRSFRMQYLMYSARYDVSVTHDGFILRLRHRQGYFP